MTCLVRISEKTQKEDLGQTSREEGETPTKWEVYERIQGVPYYAVFSRVADRLRVFKLKGGKYTEEIGHGDRLWIPEAGLWVGVWRGIYKSAERLWLRWYDAEGNLIPTDAERAEQERLRAEQERLRADQANLELARERERAERLAEMLRRRVKTLIRFDHSAYSHLSATIGSTLVARRAGM